MSLEQMQYGANAPMEFNAGYERAQQDTAENLEELKKMLEQSRDELVKAREALAKLQAHEAFGMARMIYPAMEAFGNMLAPIMEKRLKDFVALEVDRRVKDQTEIDREIVTAWIRDELEDTELFYTASQVDDKLSDLKDEIENDLDVSDAVEEYMSENLKDEVVNVIKRQVSFSIEVD